MNRRASRILTVCAGAWLLVIWGQSCMPATHSGAESGALLTVVQRLLPWMTDHILRKCAHFGEYALLGVLTAAALRCVVGFALLFVLGTRLAYAEIFGIAAGVCVSMALTRQWNARALAVVLLCAALCGGLYHQSPMYRNRQAYAESVSEQQQSAGELGASEQETRDALYRKYQ